MSQANTRLELRAISDRDALMAPPLLTLTDIALNFGTTPLLESAELTVRPRDRCCLVGRNGSGKSTLLKIAAGLVEPDSGVRFLQPGTTIRYLPQEPDLSFFKTARDYIEAGLIGADDNARIPYLLDALGLSGDEDPAIMSGGEIRRAALARTLAPHPDILMLDEPTNHLDLPAIEWLEKELASLPSAILLISHDRKFLENLSRRTIWIDRGETRFLDKGFSFFENWRDGYLEQEDLDQHKLKRKIHREQHWIVHGVSGRRKRNVRRVKELASLRQQVRDQKQVVGSATIAVTEGQSSGKRVAILENVSKSFEGRSIVSDFSIKIARGERIGIVGPNGSGKTTLLKLLMGEHQPDNGRIERGVNLQPLIIDQKRESLNPDWTLSEAMSDNGGDKVIVDGNSVHVIKYMKDFLFLPEQARTPLHALSGGERGRLQLARGLRLPSNLLILDEPTNDLDLETLDLLQELVADYKGTVVVVSHDRDFLDRTVTRTIAYEGKARWQVYAGGYSDMVNQRGAGVQARRRAEKAKREKSESDPAAKASVKPKLSYKHKFRLEQLPAELAALEAKKSALETIMADAEFFKRDPDGFNAALASFQEVQAKLHASEEEWLELEMLREDAG